MAKEGGGGEQWLLKGDRNTSFFHGIANGRKRKNHIFSLHSGEDQITDRGQIQEHIYEYYKKLFGKEPLRNIHLSLGVWDDNLRLSDEDNVNLVKPFTWEEVDEVLKSMKVNTAPGPDGFPVGFYKQLWSEFRPLIKEMLDDLYKGRLDTDRINYGVISLLPKIKDANTIKHYRPICLQNVILKFITKAITLRVTKVISGVVNWTQTAFIPGRYILDGCVILHEAIHELKKEKIPGVVFKIDFEKAYDRVQWEFLYEVMQKKNFGQHFISWVKKINEGGKVSININGEMGPFFKTYRGLRQGDPLSPILFNRVGDALSAILEEATKNGVLEGLVPNLVEGGLTHLQYADDTILFTKATSSNILALKFLLFCFEEMSGMKINYQKSEVYVLGVTKEIEEEIADMLNCKVGEMPFNYLGLPMGVEKLGKKVFTPLMQKIEKRLESWHSGHLSFGGREIRINSCLSSVPLYAMGFYKLPDDFHHKIDSIRGRFYWQGTGGKKKYHMIRWSALSRPKDFGGLGFIDTKVMNMCLLSKWIMKIEGGSQDMSCCVLRKKYLGQKGFFQSSAAGGSQFWRGLHDCGDILKKLVEKEVEGGNQTLFWEDVWLKKVPIKTSFPALYAVSRQQQATVNEVWNGGSWDLDFRRNLSDQDRINLGVLQNDLRKVVLTEDRDKVVWPHDNKKRFSTKSMYRVLKFGGVIDKEMQGVWDCKIPLKIKHFLYMAGRNRIPCADQLVKRNWRGVTGIVNCVLGRKLRLMFCLLVP